MPSDSLGWYLNQIGRYPLLTAKQEIILARQIRGENKRVADRARRKLFTSNLRYVVNLSRRFQRTVTTMELLDLIQYGNIGLSLAVEKFDPERGYRFSTYSRDWICQAIRRGIGGDEYLVRVPMNRLEQIRRVRRATADLHASLGRNPSYDEIATAANVTHATIQIAAVHGKQHYSLDTHSKRDDDEVAPIDQVAAPELPDTTDADAAAQALALLSDRERSILVRYYGIGQDSESMVSIAKSLGIAKFQAFQIKRRALNQVRFYLKR